MAAKSQQDIVDAIRVVADVLGIEALQVTQRNLTANSTIGWRDFERFGGFAAIRLAAYGGSVERDLAARRGTQLSNNYARKLERRLGEADYLTRRIAESVVTAFERCPVILKDRHERKPKPGPVRDRELVALISDTHYGLLVDPQEVLGNAYNWTVAARRTAMLVGQLADWKPEHRERTTLRLCLAGDLIAGAIHVVSDGDTTLIAEQIHGATTILIQAIDYLLEHYEQIHVVCVSGNHDRHPHRGKRRAASAKWDSFATAIHNGIRFAFRHCLRLTVTVPKTPYATFTLPSGDMAYLNHGDTGVKSGNVGRRIDVQAIAQQLYQVDSAGLFDRNIGVALLGHVHTALSTILPTGAALIVNGCMPGTDAYANSINIHASNPSQVVFESVPQHAVGDTRIVQLKSADDDEGLDGIISVPAMFDEH